MKDDVVSLMRDARLFISMAAWGGGQSAGYYCRHCHDWHSKDKKPKTSYRDIKHKPTCIISRVDSFLANKESTP